MKAPWIIENLILTNGYHIIEIIKDNGELWISGETGYFELTLNSLYRILDDNFIVIGANDVSTRL